MVNLYILCMVGAGAAVATQIAINAHLGAVTGSALWAANISFAVSMVAGLVALGTAILLGEMPLPNPAVWNAPSWIWLGGLGGATYVLLAILLTHRLGAAVLSAAGILGQLSHVAAHRPLWMVWRAGPSDVGDASRGDRAAHARGSAAAVEVKSPVAARSG